MAPEGEPGEATTAFVRVDVPRGDCDQTATVVRFFVAPGDEVATGIAVCRLRTDRFLYDLPAPASGIVGDLLVEPGTAIGVGTLLLSIEPRLSEPLAVVLDSGPPLRATPLARAIAAAH